MRCKNCGYKEFDYSENCSFCGIFGWDSDEFTENSKGEEGCRYNGVTLEKFHRANLASFMEPELDFHLKKIMKDDVMNVKFRDGVTEEVREHVREFMRGSAFCEADSGMVASMVPLMHYLTEKGYHWAYHVNYMEIIPIEEWVKEEIASWPASKAAFYGYILHDHLVKMGFQSEDVNKWMQA